MKRIVVIEDDEDIALSLRYNLERESYSVRVCSDGETGLRQILDRAPDLIVLDLNLPGMDGLEVCRKIRSNESTARVPIVVLSARIEEADRVRGLDLGADDYMTKPFSVKELLARVRAVLRRSDSGEERELLSAGELRVDLSARRVSVGDRELPLTRREFDLLVDLMRHPGRVRTREHLLEHVWGYTHTGGTRTVDVHIRQLRKKLGSPMDGYIETVVGLGYRFRDE